MAMAAEELIKAAASHVEATSLQTSIDSLKTSMDSKMNTLSQSISNLKDEVTNLNTSMALQIKNQKLEWAFSNAGYESFKYYQKGGCGDVDSEGLVQGILISFRQGRGHYITGKSMTSYSANQIEEGEKNFRDALSNQIYDLIGHEPRVSLADNGYAIYYS